MNRQQVRRVVVAALGWKAQGARTKWSTRPSVELWDAVEELERAFDPVQDMRRAVAAMLRKQEVINANATR